MVLLMGERTIVQKIVPLFGVFVPLFWEDFVPLFGSFVFVPPSSAGGPWDEVKMRH